MYPCGSIAWTYRIALRIRIWRTIRSGANISDTHSAAGWGTPGPSGFRTVRPGVGHGLASEEVCMSITRTAVAAVVAGSVLYTLPVGAGPFVQDTSKHAAGIYLETPGKDGGGQIRLRGA